jgi:hypothetical protein
VLFLVHRFLSPWWRRRQVPPKRRFLQELHGVTSQKTQFFIVTAVKTSNLTYIFMINSAINYFKSTKNLDVLLFVFYLNQFLGDWKQNSVSAFRWTPHTALSIRLSCVGPTWRRRENTCKIWFLRSVRRLLVTVSVVPSSPILVTLMKEALSSSETSVFTRATRRNITPFFRDRIQFPKRCVLKDIATNKVQICDSCVNIQSSQTYRYHYPVKQVAET